MADSSVTFQTTTLATPPGATAVSTRTNLSSEHMQVVMQGIDGSDSVVPSSAANGLTVDVTRVQGTVTADTELTTGDLDTGAGTDTRAVVGVVLAASGGGVLAPGDTANGLDVDVTRVSGTVTVDSELPAAAALADTTANPTTPSAGVLNLLFNGTTWDRARGDITNGLDVDVTRLPALAAGSNLIGNVGLDPRTAGGLTISRVLSAASTNGTSVKASAGQVYGWYLYNANAAVRYLKLYNKASAPTVGTDTPVMTIPIPPGAAANVEFTQGIAFATGIAFALTTGVADADTAAVAANELIINLLYK